ncbi:hypothetical protein Poli38472_014508 [Pythium oligandrum]|uniref:Uncharacterized protein n=1 Tax=Pythium oligandrum TaxID=41045 RepID=A0A8K1CF47_PYTOL|nr:hypothetical protein Poli38472_014508 [Pythium oligandrum]|eukprot:TMW61047.1 hypothetical protein Poli38472_014508 [Pythium oligandrum]
MPAPKAEAGNDPTGTDLPPGIVDLLQATPSLLGDSVVNAKTLATGNNVTIAGSRIIFGRPDRQTLISTIRSMVLNSTPGSGDSSVTQSILAVLGVTSDDPSMRSQIRAVLASREHEEILTKCIEALVDVAMKDDLERLQVKGSDIQAETRDSSDDE